MEIDLIERYIAEIGRQLPAKSRADIEAEIRSLLQDILDERARQAGRPVDDEMILQVLQEYGSPEKVAASYLGDRSLIGPRLYPAFIKVLQIVLPVIGVLALLGLGFSLAYSATSASSIFEVIARAFSEFFGSIISALGVITLIFALLERSVPDLKTKESRWEARSLYKVSSPEQVKPVELMLEIFFSGLAILVFNFLPQVLGFTPSLNPVVESGSWQEVTFIPILSETFMAYVPFITALCVLTIILDAILLQRNRWETWSRWCLVAIKVLGIGLAAAMLAGPSLVAVDVETLLASGVHTLETATTLVTLLNQGVRVGLIMSILFGGLDLLKMLLRLLRVKSAPVLVKS